MDLDQGCLAAILIASSLAPEWAQIPVEPVETLVNCFWTRKGAVPAIVDHMFFVFARRPAKLEDRILRRLQWESGIVPSVQQEHRNGHMRHEIERVCLRERVRGERKTLRAPQP